MESQLQELINLIKTEGVQQADKDAQSIRHHAQKEASTIIQNAHDEAKQIVENAKNERTRIEESGKQALQQAGRNLLIGLRGEIIALFDRILKADVGEALTVFTMESMLEKIAVNWRHSKPEALEVLLDQNDLELLKEKYCEKLKKKFRNGIVLKPVDTVDKGFFIGEKGENTYYDFTDDGLAEMLGQYLNPGISAILREGNVGS